MRAASSYRRDILPGGLVPTEVLRHAVLHQLRPLLLVVERDECAIDRIEQRLCFITLELESSAGIEAGIPFFNRVVESAGRAHHRHGSVFERIDLVQTAGLESAWHQKNVGACLHLVRQGFVIADLHGEAAGVGVGEVAKEFLVVGLAGPQRDNGNIAFCEPARDLSPERSKPFCEANREQIPITGVCSGASSPKACSRSFRQSRLPARSAGV